MHPHHAPVIVGHLRARHPLGLIGPLPHQHVIRLRRPELVVEQLLVVVGLRLRSVLLRFVLRVACATTAERKQAQHVF